MSQTLEERKRERENIKKLEARGEKEPKKISKEDKESIKEIDNMLPEDNIVKLSNGGELEIKPLSWGKEIKICKLLSSFLSESELLTAVDAISKIKDGESMEALSDLIIPLIQQAPDAITKIMSIITNEDVTFIEESLTSEDVMKVFIPFLTKLFSKYMNMFEQGIK